MIAEILTTGEEIRTGALVDSNSAHIAEALHTAGVRVGRLNGVGDDRDAIAGILTEIGGRADLAVVTGGLGPTVDDRSAEAAAAAAGAALRCEPQALASIEAFFLSRGRPVTASSRKQAMLPSGSEVLPNPVGTAPGFSLTIGRCRFFFLPGVPFEMRRMLAEQVLPRIEAMRGPNREHHLVATISCFGLTESMTGERLEGLEGQFSGVRLGLRAKFPEIQVKLYCEETSRSEAARRIARAGDWAKERLGDAVFSESGEAMEAVVGRLLREAGATLAVAESCTGGLISHRLTEVPGSSEYFLLSAVTYANEAKIRLLGVSPQTLERHGAVDEETAREMACGARRFAGATYGLATSGVAGPGGGSEEKPVGTVCIGLATPGGSGSRRFRFNYGRRSMHKEIFAMQALDMLRRKLLYIR
jgi:nicotinamide-nucleotide amidase